MCSNIKKEVREIISGKRILLIEDDARNREIAKLALEEFETVFESVEGGPVALELLDKEEYDLLLVDCHMPVIDGFLFTKLFRGIEGAHNKRTPVIAVTADVMIDIGERCREAGMDGCLLKPYTEKQFLDAVYSIFSCDLLNMPPETFIKNALDNSVSKAT